MKGYEKYKEVGLPWLREIPEKWNIDKLKRLFYIDKDLSDVENPVVLSLARDGVKIRDITNNQGQMAASYKNYNKVKIGDLLLNPMDLYSGANCNVSYVEGVISPAYIKLRKKEEVCERYFDYWFKLQYTSLAFQAVGKGVSKDNRWTLTNETLMNYQSPIPPLSEQKQIANFLDWKISEINRLIELEKDHMDTLDELFSTKLNKIFDNITGETKKLRFVFTFGKGLNITKDNLGEEGNKCISYGDIHGKMKFSVDSRNDDLKKLSNVENVVISEFALLSKGDFIFADTSEDVLGSGDFSFIENDTELLYAGYHTVVAKPKIKFDFKFLAYQFESNSWRKQIRKAINGIKVYSITQQILKQSEVILPDLEIQKKIVIELDDLNSKMKKYKTLSKDEIANLEELKQTLIFDAVTGKIDVRNIKIPQDIHGKEED